MIKLQRLCLLIPVAALLLPARPVAAQSNQDLAKQLSNPVASLISVPMQLNYDKNIGSDDQGERLVLNLQPVVPVELNEEWNLTSRTILPVIKQDHVPAGTSSSGTGDIVQSLFFSPQTPGSHGWIWGVGPAFLLPTASDRLLGSEQWGGGFTAVALKQNMGLTYGALMNQVWRLAGDDDRQKYNALFLQPFVSYTTASALTYSLNLESTYNWTTEEWGVPVNVAASQVFRVGNQLLSVGAGLRYWADSNAGTGEGVGFRITLTMLFPR